MKKYVDESWDFRRSDTKTLTHCFHSYPAMMIPQVAAGLLEKYGAQARRVLDPYCGTGTSMVEANLRGLNAVGIDLNPLACLIAKAKTTQLNFQKLDLYLKNFNDFLFAARFGSISKEISLPTFANIDFWFEKSVQRDLAVIKSYVIEIAEPDVQNFFAVAFSETVRESSWTRNGEFKLFRMTEEHRARFQPDVFGTMEAKLARNRKGLQAFLELNKQSAVTEVFHGDATDENFVEQRTEGKFDLIITSPPYGDSQTTVAYGQFSRLSSQWLDLANIAQLDNFLMGGKRKKQASCFESKILKEKLSQIADREEKRALQVSAFYWDYRNSIGNVSRLMKKKGFVCYVVGNRKVKGVQLPTDEITKEFFVNNNFRHVETIIRNIPNKRMPSKNSPTNISGAKDDTMTKEYIVVMQKN